MVLKKQEFQFHFHNFSTFPEALSKKGHKFLLVLCKKGDPVHKHAELPAVVTMWISEQLKVAAASLDMTNLKLHEQ